MSTDSRTKNTARNILWGLIFRFTSILLPFINRTIIIYTLGMEYTGIASLFTSILSVLSLAEMGINTAILFSMYGTVSKHDVERTNSLLALYKKTYRIIGSIVTVIGILIAIRIDLFIAGDYPASLNIYIVYLLFLSNSVASYFFFAYMGVVLTANQRDDIIYRINMSVNIGKEIIQFIILITTKNYYLYLIILVSSTIINNAATYFVAKKKYPEYVANGELSKKEKSEIKSQIAGLVIGKLSVVSRNSFDSIIISAFLGLVSTAIYGNYYYVMYSLFGVVYLFCSGMRASIGNKVVTADIKENYHDMMVFSYGFYVIYGTCTTCLFCAYQQFMQLWVGLEYVANISLPLLMSIYFFLFCGVGVISQYWDAAGLFWQNRYRFIVEAILNLVLNIVFVQIWGITGVILSTTVSMLLATNIMGPIVLFKYYFKKCDISEYYKKQTVYLCVTILNTVLCYLICSHFHISGIIGLIIICLFCGFFSLPFNILFFVRKGEFDSVIVILNRLLGKRMQITKNRIILISILSIICAFLVLLVGLSISSKENKTNVSSDDYIPVLEKVIMFADLGLEDFTCTGMAYDKNSDELYIANYGANYIGEEVNPEIVVLDYSQQKEKRRICLPGGVFSDSTNLQGISYDVKDNSIWLSTGEGLFEIDKTGELVKSINLEAYLDYHPNGIAYDEKDDSIWVLCMSTYLLNYSKDGVLKASYYFENIDQDQLYSDGDFLFITAGIDYLGNENYILVYDKIKHSISNVYYAEKSYAIEGICFVTKDTMLVCNDGKYHDAKIKHSYISKYRFECQ